MNVNDLINRFEEEKEKYDKYKANDRIKKVLKFLDDKRYGKWHFAKANFGDNYLWSKFDTENDTYSAIQRQKHYTYQDIESMKGLNYGQFEFGAEHFCVIMSNIRRGIKVVHVLPMTSLGQKKSSEKWHIVLKKEDYPFLSHDTILLANRIQEIGIERFSIKQMDRLSLEKYMLSVSDIKNVKEILERQFL